MIDVLFYNTVNNYINKKVNKKKIIPLSKKDFIRYLINAGGFRNKGVSFSGQRFYFHLVNMALTESNQKFYITGDYFNRCIMHLKKNKELPKRSETITNQCNICS